MATIEDHYDTFDDATKDVTAVIEDHATDPDEFDIEALTRAVTRPREDAHGTVIGYELTRTDDAILAAAAAHRLPPEATASPRAASGPTPYDRGTRLEPHPWVANGITGSELPRPAEDDDYGRVDFDTDEGATIATLHIERTEQGRYVLHIASGENLAFEVSND